MTTQSIGSIQSANALDGLLPCEGAKFLQYNCKFGTFDTFSFDFTSQFQQRIFTTIQCLFIDNGGNAQPVDVTVNGGQTFKAPANSCGYYTLLMAEPPSAVLHSTGGVDVNIQFMNFYVPPTVWLV